MKDGTGSKRAEVGMREKRKGRKREREREGSIPFNEESKRRKKSLSLSRYRDSVIHVSWCLAV